MFDTTPDLPVLGIDRSAPHFQEGGLHTLPVADVAISRWGHSFFRAGRWTSSVSRGLPRPRGDGTGTVASALRSRRSNSQETLDPACAEGRQHWALVP